MNVFDNKINPVKRIELFYIEYPPNNPPPITGGKGSGSTSKNPGGSPGLLTSTGGLFGVNGFLLSPVINGSTGNSYILLMDPNNFNCEEDAEYDFPQEIPPRNAPQEGRNVTCHLVILKYRELGYAKFSVNVTVYQKTTDTFSTVKVPVIIPTVILAGKRKATFPDKRIHTVYLPFEITGERPQVTITYKGNSGPVSITSLTLCGNADEMPQQ